MQKNKTMENYNEKAYKEAKKKVEKLKGFYFNLMSYVVVCAFLVALNLYQNSNYLWSLWVVFGWGLGVAIQAVKVFVGFSFFSKEWEERKIKEFMGKS